MLGILILLFGVVLAIGLHELGHMVPAKRFGVKVPQYFIGFGPAIYSFRRGETEYGLKAIPLGGYVRLAGMYPARNAGGRAWRSGLVEDARAESRSDLAPGEENRAFSALSVPRKLVVMFGGPFMNWMLALALLLVGAVGLGTGTTTNLINGVSACVPEQGTSTCAPGAAPSPAQTGGLQAGDRIISWNSVPVETWADLQVEIRSSPISPLPVGIERDGVSQMLTITPVLTERLVYGEDGQPVMAGDEPVTELVPFVGLTPAIELVRQSPGTAIDAWWRATGLTFQAIFSIPQQLWHTLGGLTNPDSAGAPDRAIVSVVGVGALAGSIGSAASAEYTTAMRAADMLNLLASLNLALFAFNLIPLPPLDGGHIAGALIEGARRTGARLLGRQDPGLIDTARALPLAYLVMGLLLTMTMVLIWADIAQPIF